MWYSTRDIFVRRRKMYRASFVFFGLISIASAVNYAARDLPSEVEWHTWVFFSFLLTSHPFRSKERPQTTLKPFLPNSQRNSQNTSSLQPFTNFIQKKALAPSPLPFTALHYPSLPFTPFTFTNFPFLLIQKTNSPSLVSTKVKNSQNKTENQFSFYSQSPGAVPAKV